MQQTWLMKSVVIELRVTSLNRQRSHTERLMALLLDDSFHLQSAAGNLSPRVISMVWSVWVCIFSGKMSALFTFGIIYVFMLNKISIYTVSQKKTSQFNFRHNFAICWDTFTIFEAPCSGLIAGWCNLLHTYHRCEAFTWRDVIHDLIQAIARSAHCTWFHTAWLMMSELTGLKSCWLFFLEYHAREGVPDTYSEYRWVETSASSGVGRAGPQAYRCSYWTAATASPSQCVWLVCECSGGYFDQYLQWIFM